MSLGVKRSEYNIRRWTNVLKTSEVDSRSRTFSLVAKLAQCWTGPY